MKQEIIDKLPPDAQKEFLKLAMKLDEKTKQEKVHKDFLTFVSQSRSRWHINYKSFYFAICKLVKFVSNFFVVFTFNEFWPDVFNKS